MKADIIVLGPGSLYTSILPNLLVEGIPEALHKTKAKVVYVSNVMTQPGETDDYTAEDHVRKVIQYLGEDILDSVIVNTGRAHKEAYRKYRKEGAKRVKYHEDELRKLNVDVIEVNLITNKNLLRHDPDKLAKAVIGLR